MLNTFNFIEHRQARVLALRRQFIRRALMAVCLTAVVALWWHEEWDRAIRAKQERHALLVLQRERLARSQAQADRAAARVEQARTQLAQIEQQRAQAVALPLRLAALADALRPGLRLQRVEMDHDRMRVIGIAQHEEQVTRYLQALQAQPSVGGALLSLELGEVRRVEHGAVLFELVAPAHRRAGGAG